MLQGFALIGQMARLIFTEISANIGVYPFIKNLTPPDCKDYLSIAM